jgi:hypothetical protein
MFLVFMINFQLQYLLDYIEIILKVLVVFDQVGAELPVDSEDAEIENKTDGGSTLLYVFERGCKFLRC